MALFTGRTITGTFGTKEKKSLSTMMGTSLIGMLTVGALMEQRTFKKVPDTQLADRTQWFDEDNMVEMTASFSERPLVVYTGVSAVGVGYTPTIPNPTGNSQPRKWPREWHGETM